MNFFLQSVEYILTLKDKGFSDESFYNEYTFICYETYKIRNPKSIQEVNSIQTEILLHREKLK